MSDAGSESETGSDSDTNSGATGTAEDSDSEETDDNTTDSGSSSESDTPTDDGSTDDGGTGDGSTDDGGDTCEPPAGTCEWDELEALSCAASECCGGLTCLGDRCIDACGEADDFLDPFAVDFTVFGRICAYQGSRSVVSLDGGCEQPIIYHFDATHSEVDAELSIAVRRAPLSLFAPSLVFSPVYDATHAWPSATAPSSPPANFSVNPAQTKLVYWITDTGDGTSTLYQVDLGTDAVRTLPGVYPGMTRWLDNDRILQCADGIGDGIGLDEEGLWVIDTSGPTLNPTFVAGRFQCGGPLGLVGTTTVLTGGAPVVGGTAPALGAIPLSTLEAVLTGDREPIDIYGDPEIQRFSRGDVWQHFGTVHGGQWFVAPANPDYTAYQLEVMTVTNDTVTFAPPISLPMGDLPYADVLHVGANKFVVNTGDMGAVIALE